ncbi:hypothetical protein [Aquimarina sp. I32.4]|uniref:hypothetical protein n=1 Tax=Aquimarina sp. I32.4 TaxID=2053903 RepID=UPI0013049575|nr:hypothetical protein [Aquimarina sp. I32.4]
MEEYEYDLPKIVLYSIVVSLGINVNTFETNLSNNKPKEMMICGKIYDLYREAQNKEE